MRTDGDYYSPRTRQEWHDGAQQHYAWSVYPQTYCRREKSTLAYGTLPEGHQVCWECAAKERRAAEGRVEVWL